MLSRRDADFVRLFKWAVAQRAKVAVAKPLNPKDHTPILLTETLTIEGVRELLVPVPRDLHASLTDFRHLNQATRYRLVLRLWSHWAQP